MLYYRDRFDVPLTDQQVKNVEYYKPSDSSPEIKYLKACRLKLGGNLPERSSFAKPIKTPSEDVFKAMKESTGKKEMSTTMVLVRMLTSLLRDKNVAPRLVPIIPDEARTFGMEGFFQKIGIYAHEGQKYEPVDSEQLSSYREDIKGQVLEEGITEAGAMSSWIAAGTSYTNHDLEMIPIYLFYSMFGFQRTGDFAWAAGDNQTRGFLIGATAGRTTLAGEGLQHADGHSHVLSSVIPNCKSYDPTFSYELATIFREGLRRMYDKREKIFYYITTMNENYSHPAMPKDKSVEEGILKGMYLFKEHNRYKKTKIQLLGSGTILREIIAAAEILQNEYQIDSNVWSVTSFNELRKEAIEVGRRCLNEYVVSGVPTTINALLQIISSDAFLEGKVHVNYIEENLNLFVDNQLEEAYEASVSEAVIISVDDSPSDVKAPKMPKKIGVDLSKNSSPEVIVAEMQGTIVDIMIKEGKKIKKNDALFVIEAMKMENIVSSPIDGVVKELNITKGSPVSKGDVILVIKRK